MIRTFLLLTISMFVNLNVYSQDFDSQLEELAKGIAAKINAKGKTRVAVWGFYSESGERSALGNFITEDFSVYVTNFGINFEVIDRNHLNVLIKEHKLNAEGYIDQNTAKELGKIAAVDAVITGTYTVLNTSIKVRAKVLDTETALQFAADMATLPMNEDVASYLGVSVNGGNTTNKGFNTPLNSKETINDPKTVNPKCNEENFGDACFYNNTDSILVLRIFHFKYLDISKQSGSYKDIFLDIGETKCVYNLISRPITYYIATMDIFQKELEGNPARLNSQYDIRHLMDKGELKVETCKSKTYTIK